MEGKEADLGVSSPFIPPDAPAYLYNDEQMRDMQEPEAAEKARPQALSQVTGRPLSGKAAVEAAAANPGGIMLMYYNMVNWIFPQWNLLSPVLFLHMVGLQNNADKEKKTE